MHRIGLERAKGIGQVGKKGQQQGRPADGRTQQKRKPLPSQHQQYSRQEDQGQQFYQDGAGKCASCQEQSRKVFASRLGLSMAGTGLFGSAGEVFPIIRERVARKKKIPAVSMCPDAADLEDRQRLPGIECCLPGRLAKGRQEANDQQAASQVENDQQQLDADDPSAEQCSRGKDQLGCGRIDGDEVGMVDQLLQAGKGFGCRLQRGRALRCTGSFPRGG